MTYELNIPDVNKEYNIKITKIVYDDKNCSKFKTEKFKQFPWYNEPDSIKFIDQDTNYLCSINRLPQSGHLNGYVYVPYKHYLNLYKTKSLDYINSLSLSTADYDLAHSFDVHGGITYDNYCKEVDKQIIGFDCSYWYDLIPLSVLLQEETNINLYTEILNYKDNHFVMKELKSLASQIKNIKEK